MVLPLIHIDHNQQFEMSTGRMHISLYLKCHRGDPFSLMTRINLVSLVSRKIYVFVFNGIRSEVLPLIIIFSLCFVLRRMRNTISAHTKKQVTMTTVNIMINCCNEKVFGFFSHGLLTLSAPITWIGCSVVVPTANTLCVVSEERKSFRSGGVGTGVHILMVGRIFVRLLP